MNLIETLALACLLLANTLTLSQATTGQATEREIAIQYQAPVEGPYTHGDHCMDSRVF